MKQNVIETVLGAVVLLVALGFLVFAYGTADLQKVDGYTLYADFTSIDGVKSGNDIRISGVKVGSIDAITLNEDNYRAKIKMVIDEKIKLPLDTVAIISSEGLLGGKYLGLEPGGDEEFLADGDEIEYTQSTPSLEKLIGQVIYSVSDKKDDKAAATETTPVALDEPVTETTQEEPVAQEKVLPKAEPAPMPKDEYGLPPIEQNTTTQEEPALHDSAEPAVPGEAIDPVPAYPSTNQPE